MDSKAEETWRRFRSRMSDGRPTVGFEDGAEIFDTEADADRAAWLVDAAFTTAHRSLDTLQQQLADLKAERDRYREALVGLPDPSTLHWACGYCYTWNSADKEHCQECRRWAARWVGGIRIFDPEILITRSELQALVDALSPSSIAPETIIDVDWLEKGEEGSKED